MIHKGYLSNSRGQGSKKKILFQWFEVKVNPLGYTKVNLDQEMALLPRKWIFLDLYTLCSHNTILLALLIPKRYYLLRFSKYFLSNVYIGKKHSWVIFITFWHKSITLGTTSKLIHLENCLFLFLRLDKMLIHLLITKKVYLYLCCF